MAAEDFHPDGTLQFSLTSPTHDINKTHSSVGSDSIPIPPNSTTGGLSGAPCQIWWILRLRLAKEPRSRSHDEGSKRAGAEDRGELSLTL